MIGNQKVNSIMIESNHEFSLPAVKVVYDYTMSLFCKFRKLSEKKLKQISKLSCEPN